MLASVNEFRTPQEFAHIGGFIEDGVNVLIDSGVYWLATQHAKARNLTMDQALGADPESIEEFAWLFDNYVKVVERFGERSWGYIEIDQGGRENKIRTRARLEALGLRPIPVYHPFNDRWD
jgi:hypothetical protein